MKLSDILTLLQLSEANPSFQVVLCNGINSCI